MYGKENYVTNLDTEMNKKNRPLSEITNIHNQKRKYEQSIMNDYHHILLTERSSKKYKVIIEDKTKAKDRMKAFFLDLPSLPPNLLRTNNLTLRQTINIQSDLHHPGTDVILHLY